MTMTKLQPLPETRELAIEQGVTRYKTGKPCKYGHKAERTTINASCCICSIIKAKERREWIQSKLPARKEKFPLTIPSREILKTNIVPTVLVKPDKIPFQKIVDLYHKMLPTLPQCKKLTTVRKSYIKGRWIEDEMETLEQWEEMFKTVKTSNFLMGRVPGRDGQPPFVANLEWLTKPANFIKISEGNYNRD